MPKARPFAKAAALKFNSRGRQMTADSSLPRQGILTIAPEAERAVDGGRATRAWRFSMAGAEDFVLRHSVPSEAAAWLVPESRGDHALLVALLHAMRRGLDIHVQGEVCPQLLAGLDTLQDIWSRWRPEVYRKVDIRADAEAPLIIAGRERGGLFAFSGGVDASYTFFRHLTGAAGRNTVRPAAALLVHGMDIPLERDDFFRGAQARAERMLSGLDIPLVPLATNSRALGLDWQDSFGLQLIACMLALQPHFSWAVKASDDAFDSLVLPWGASPLTDPLCSTAACRVRHDGCEADRTQKVDWLVRNSGICDDLRVCWQGPEKDRNCGSCEKCVRTKLNFWVNGHAIPAAFPNGLEADQVRKIVTRNQLQLSALERIERTARQLYPSSDPVLSALGTRVRQMRRRMRRKAVRRRLKQWVKRAARVRDR
jgi:hypothetical protein